MRMSFLAAAIGGALSIAAATATAQQPVATADGESNPVVAKVDGSEIHLLDLVIAMEGLPAQVRNAPLQMIFTPLLRQTVQRRLVAMAAEREGLVDDEDVKRRLAQAREEVLTQAYLRSKIMEAVTARYEAELKDAPPTYEVRARHILVATLEEAETIVRELRGGGDFETIAKERSIDQQSGQQGGDLGFFSAEQMVPEFSEAAFKMKAGELSKPVKSDFGWHLIRVEERREGPPASLQDRLPTLMAEMQEEVVGSLLNGLEQAATIEAFNPDGSPLDLKPAEKAE